MNLMAAVSTATLLVAVQSVTAHAAVVDPVAYTVDYCRLRAEGKTQQQAVRFAVMSNIDHSREATMLPDGADLDIRLGYHGIMELCPEFAFDE